jgi:hypothetical protein
MKNDIFKTLFFLARPAAGKSEIIRYLEGLPENERKERFHIGKMIALDDFPCCGLGLKKMICWNRWESHGYTRSRRIL